MAIPQFPNLRAEMEKVGLLAAFKWLSQDWFQYVTSWLHPSNAYKPPHLTDAAAENDSVYYSVTASKMVYKDSAGAVHNLY
jgi:hypothetical protein